MSKYIEALKRSSLYHRLMKDEFYMNFAIKKADSTTIRKYSFIHMLELTDLGWVFANIANTFDDKLPLGERITLGYMMTREQEYAVSQLDEQRDHLQLFNGFSALKEYKETGKTTVLLPWDMATSAIILMSALYACTKSMEMVGLTSKSKTIKDFMLEPVNDTYMSLYHGTLDKLPPSKRAEMEGLLSRKEMKNGVTLPDLYGSVTSILNMPEVMHEPYERTKQEIIPAYILHREWSQQSAAILEERGEVEVTWTDPVSGMLAGYTCLDTETAEVILRDGAEFSVSRMVKGKPHHLPLQANPVHNTDAILLHYVDNEADKHVEEVTLFTTHDAINCTPGFTNQIRQWTMEGIIEIAMSGYLSKVSEDIGVPAPVTGDVAAWIKNLNPHGFMS